VPERAEDPVEKMRVICPMSAADSHKLFPYREYALIAVAARRLRRTIKWTATAPIISWRCAGRDNVTTARWRREDGRFSHGRRLMATWAYLSTFGPISHGAPACCRALRHSGLPLPGSHGVHQHRAGRCLSRRRAPEAAYVVERLVDAAARKLA